MNLLFDFVTGLQAWPAAFDGGPSTMPAAFTHVLVRGLKWFLVAQFGGVSVILKAIASTPSRTPADLALSGSGHADTVNSYSSRAARLADLRDHAVRLMKWRDWHGLHRCCKGQSKNNGCQPDH